MGFLDLAFLKNLMPLQRRSRLVIVLAPYPLQSLTSHHPFQPLLQPQENSLPALAHVVLRARSDQKATKKVPDGTVKAHGHRCRVVGAMRLGLRPECGRMNARRQFPSPLKEAGSRRDKREHGRAPVLTPDKRAGWEPRLLGVPGLTT